MGRRIRNNARTAPQKVESVELSEKNIALRVVALVVLVAIALSGIGYGVYLLVHRDPGWEVIEPAPASTSCAAEFQLTYNLGQGETPAKAESRSLNALYSQALVTAYQLFTESEGFDDICNVFYLNEHPNETVTLDPALYHAFEQIVNSGDRTIYLAPAYLRYNDLFDCTFDSQTVDFDPLVSDEVAAEYAELAAYANDTASVNLELLGENQVILHVSEEYRTFMSAIDCTTFVDFGWLKNAFLIDYLAETLNDAGYTNGTLRSVDGFTRFLGDGAEEVGITLYDRVGSDVWSPGTAVFQKVSAAVALRDYGLTAQDNDRFYQYEDGTIRAPYLDPTNALPKAAHADVLCHSETTGCAEMLLSILSLYVTDSFDPAAYSALTAQGIHTVYSDNFTVFHTDEHLTLIPNEDEQSPAYTDEKF